MVALVVAQANNRVIGRNNLVPWHMRGDLVRLRNLTVGKMVVLGRKTYESMDQYYTETGRQMPGRKYLVVTTDSAFKPARENAVSEHLVTHAIVRGKELGDGEVMVIGGASIYKEALAYANRIYMTQILADVEGDTFFPKLKSSEWEPVERVSHPADEKNPFPYEFLIYDRVGTPLQT